MLKLTIPFISIRICYLFLLFLVIFLIIIRPVQATEPIWSYISGNAIESVSISKDGQYVAAGSSEDNDTVYYFDHNGELLWSYNTKISGPSVSVSAIGRYVVTSSDRNLNYIDRNGKIVWSYPTGIIASISFSMDDGYIAAGSYDGNVYYFNSDGHLLWSYADKSYKESRVLDIKVSADGQYIAARIDSKIVPFPEKLYYFNRDGNLLWTIPQGGWANMGLAVSANGQYILTGTQDNKISCFNRDGKLLWTYPTGDWARDVAVSSDGQYVSAGSSDNKVYYLSGDGRLIWSYPTGGDIYTLAMSADGQYVAAGSSDGNLYYFNRDGKLLWTYPTGDWARDVAVSSDGQYIVIGSNKVIFFNREGASIRTIERRQAPNLTPTPSFPNTPFVPSQTPAKVEGRNPSSILYNIPPVPQKWENIVLDLGSVAGDAVSFIPVYGGIYNLGLDSVKTFNDIIEGRSTNEIMEDAGFVVLDGVSIAFPPVGYLERIAYVTQYAADVAKLFTDFTAKD